MKKIEVVAAVIQHQKKILAVQRGPAKYAYISQNGNSPAEKLKRDKVNTNRFKVNFARDFFHLKANYVLLDQHFAKKSHSNTFMTNDLFIVIIKYFLVHF